MRTVRTVAELRAALAEPRRNGRTIGARADDGLPPRRPPQPDRAARGAADLVVVSLFVNPAQFNDAADLDAYPRDEARDAGLAQEAGADLLFAPSLDEVYPPGFATQVRVAGPLTETLEGAHRGAEHFHGVTTVVTKLLNMVGPDVAFFGQKDAQQALVIRRLAATSTSRRAIEVGPTVREPDGLALSSRNVRLAAEDRARALALSRALRAAAGHARRRRARRRRDRRRRPRGHDRPSTSSPSTSRSSTPKTCAPWAGRPGARSWRSPPTSGRSDSSTTPSSTQTEEH